MLTYLFFMYICLVPKLFFTSLTLVYVVSMQRIPVSWATCFSILDFNNNMRRLNTFFFLFILALDVIIGYCSCLDSNFFPYNSWFNLKTSFAYADMNSLVPIETWNRCSTNRRRKPTNAVQSCRCFWSQWIIETWSYLV